MPERVQPIYSDNPGALPATFILPPGLDLEVSSIRARVNGAAAAATFIVVCETLTSDGRIMAQSRIDQEFAVGDTVAATWAPFLRRQAAASAAGAEIPFMRRRKTAAQAIVSGGETFVTWGSDTVSDAAYFEASGNGIKVKQDGLYSVFLRLFWSQWPNAHLGIINGVDPDGFGGYPIVNTNAFSQVSNGSGGGDFRLNANRTITVTVHHQFGANRNLDTGTYLEARYLGDANMDGRDS